MKFSRLTQLLMLILTVSSGAFIACGSEAATDSPPQAESSRTSAPTNDPRYTVTSPAPSVTAAPATKLNVVTTTNIVADWVRQVGKDRVEVFSLVPADVDPHTFQPGGQDIRRIADADLVLSVGLSLEAGWMNELLSNASRDPAGIVVLGDSVDPLETAGPAQDEADNSHDGKNDGDDLNADDDHGDDGDNGPHGQGRFDPHFWMDPLRAKRAINDISARLSVLDPDAGSQYRDNAAAYEQELDGLDRWIEEQVDLVPAERRLLVTGHDNLQYFAVRYGFEIIGTIIPGATTDRESTPQDLARLVEDIEEHQAPAVFGESFNSDRLARRIAEETGAVLVGSLYTGSLGAVEGPVASYLNLMRYNVEIIVEALR